jgi:hypothetical protein
MRKKKPVRLVPKRYRFDPWWYQLTGATPPGPATLLQWPSRAEARTDVEGEVDRAPDNADDGGDGVND